MWRCSPTRTQNSPTRRSPHRRPCRSALCAAGPYDRSLPKALAGARRSPAARADQHHIRCLERRLALDDAARLARTARLGVALDHIQALDHHPARFRQRFLDLAALATILAGDNQHLIASFDMHSVTSIQLQTLAEIACCCTNLTICTLQSEIYSTSGASEIIFINAFSRSSRATGPKIRVPRGLFSLPMITAALSSKRICEPSGRTYSWQFGRSPPAQPRPS